jgi:hypothetical protein
MVVPPQAFLGAAFLMLLLARGLVVRARPHYPRQPLFFILLNWIFLVDLLNFLRIGSFQELRHLIGRIVFFVIVLTTYSVVRDLRQYRRVLAILMASVTGLAVYTIFCAISGFDPFEIMPERPRVYWGISMFFCRTCGIPMSYGKYGLMVNAVLPLFLLSAWKKGFLLPRFWARAGTFLLLFALFVTQSRNCWVATFLALCFFIFMINYNPHKRLRNIIVITGGIPVAIVSILLFSDYFY